MHVIVSDMPEAMCATGKGQHLTSTALYRQQAGSVLPVAMQHNVIACNTTQQPQEIPHKTRHTEHATGLELVPIICFPKHPTLQAIYFPTFPQNPNPRAAVQPHKESIIRLTGLDQISDSLISRSFTFFSDGSLH